MDAPTYQWVEGALRGNLCVPKQMEQDIWEGVLETFENRLKLTFIVNQLIQEFCAKGTDSSKYVYELMSLASKLELSFHLTDDIAKYVDEQYDEFRKLSDQAQSAILLNLVQRDNHVRSEDFWLKLLDHDQKYQHHVFAGLSNIHPEIALEIISRIDNNVNAL